MNQLRSIIQRAQEEFGMLLKSASDRGPVTIEQYVRYLSMQYHLTKGVQRYFITAAAHSDLARRRKLRKFLFDFANEEELHYIVAGNDLHKLGKEPLPEPFDVTLWHSYFEKIVVTRPFVRLGAACILENISAGVARPYVKQALSAPFLTRDNSKFLVLHQHETLPHGDELLEALADAALGDAQIKDLVSGAKEGTVFYLRMAEWALNPSGIASIADPDANYISNHDLQQIAEFEMNMLNA